MRATIADLITMRRWRTRRRARTAFLAMTQEIGFNLPRANLPHGESVVVYDRKGNWWNIMATGCGRNGIGFARGDLRTAGAGVVNAAVEYGKLVVMIRGLPETAIEAAMGKPVSDIVSIPPFRGEPHVTEAVAANGDMVKLTFE